MSKKKLTEQEAAEKIEGIIAGLPPESSVAKALRNVVDSAGQTVADDELSRTVSEAVQAWLRNQGEK